MGNIFDQNFIDINVTVLLEIIGPLPFDIFIRRAEDTFTKVSKKGDAADANRYKKYMDEKGVSTFSIKKEDYGAYLKYVAQVSNRFFESGGKRTTEEIISVVKDVADLVMLELVHNKVVDQRSVSYATNVIKGCLRTMEKDPISLVRILKLISYHPYAFRHALTTTVFALLLAKAEKLVGVRNLEVLGLGALMHDVGMSMLSFDPDTKTDLSPEEWKEIKMHPEVGKRMVENIKNIPTESKLIILQHHEQPNGNGYPNSLYNKEIYYFAKIVAIADTFTALILARPYRSQVYTPYEALEVMRYDRGKFDQQLVDSFSTIFIKTKALKNTGNKKAG